MDILTFAGAVLGSTVIVKIIDTIIAGRQQKKRARREIETERDRLVMSRNIWQEHALQLRSLVREKGCRPPDLPKDTWPISTHPDDKE